VLSGFATTDLSVRFCDACQGGGAYGKKGHHAAFPFHHHATVRFSRAFMCMLLPLAAAERPERSD
ncbi:hypothetical protein QUH32_30615, partial [Klebsiella pneumoniae]|nr:hypothetical protein [Klebsiella pneumoniae]